MDIAAFETMLVTIATPLAQAAIDITSLRGREWHQQQKHPVPRITCSSSSSGTRTHSSVPYEYRPLTATFKRLKKRLVPRRRRRLPLYHLPASCPRPPLDLEDQSTQLRIVPTPPSNVYHHSSHTPPLRMTSVTNFSQFLLYRQKKQYTTYSRNAEGSASLTRTETSYNSSDHRLPPPGKPPD